MSSLELLAMPKLRNLPPSSQKIYSILQKRTATVEEELLSSQELAIISKYSPRTVRYALNKLIDKELVIKVPDLFDARRCYWVIKPIIKGRIPS